MRGLCWGATSRRRIIIAQRGRWRWKPLAWCLGRYHDAAIVVTRGPLVTAAASARLQLISLYWKLPSPSIRKTCLTRRGRWWWAGWSGPSLTNWRAIQAFNNKISFYYFCFDTKILNLSWCFLFSSLRSFYASKSHDGCPKDLGWIAVTEPKQACVWDQHSAYPFILYSKKDYATQWYSGKINIPETFHFRTNKKLLAFNSIILGVYCYLTKNNDFIHFIQVSE